MKTLRLIFTLSLATCLFGAYTYFYSDTFTSINSTYWAQVGTYLPSGSASGLVGNSSSSGAPGALFYYPSGPSRYEVKATLPSANSHPSTYYEYLGASGPWGSSSFGNWSYYRLDTTIYANYPSSGLCTAILSLRRYESINDGYGNYTHNLTYLGSGSAACPDNTTIRTLFSGSTGGPATLAVFVNNVLSFQATDSSPLVGIPGVGLDANGLISRVDLGPWDTVAPNNVSSGTISTSPFPYEVDIQWQAATDDTNGIGVAGYALYKDGTPILTYQTGLTYSDLVVLPGTTYTYMIKTIDLHLNVSSGVSFNVTTPPNHINHTIATPPARIGVRPTGNYWGAGGEQIDMMSGNVNWTLPLLKALGRGGSGVGFSLNYNSQMWRQDTALWDLAYDVGYGYGWRLLAGSLTPHWADPYTVDRYVFTDSTGAEYTLGTYASGVWSSIDGIHVVYDPSTYKLMFPDGTFWLMTCESQGNEPDRGTRYPKVMQDTNGNQILIRYAVGRGTVFADTSARILQIEDVRADATYHYTYQFTYNTDSTPHLTNITNAIGTAETYTFTYSTQTITSPWSTGSFPNTTLPISVSNALYTHGFEYTTGAELSKVNLPLGGYLRWQHRSFTFNASGSTPARTVREVQYRYLVKQTGGTEQTYSLLHDDSYDVNIDYHHLGTVVDPTGAFKQYWFVVQAGAWYNGLLGNFLQYGPGGVYLRRQDFNWAHPYGDPYIAIATTTLDPGTSYAKMSKTTQTADQWGNVTQTKMWDFIDAASSFSTNPTRTYNSTYLSGTNYDSRNIRNRLLTSTVDNGGTPITLLTNIYDAYGIANCTSFTSVLNALPSGPTVREHDTANYGTGFTYRGNLTASSSLAGPTCYSHYITGDVVNGMSPGGLFGSTPASSTNYAAPGLITSNNFSTTLAYSPSLGPTSVTGQNSDTTTMSYDTTARPYHTVSAHGAATDYAYTTMTSKAITNGHWTKTTMDGLGRTILSETGDASGTKTQVDTEYDSCACSPLGKMKRVSQPHVPGGTQYWTTYVYDGLGRTLSVQTPDGASTTTYAYTANTTTVTDPAGKWKKYVTDAMGNLINVIEPNPAGGTDFTTTYTYDIFNRLVGVSMPRPSGTQTRTFTYTGPNLTQAINPENGTVNYYYNSDNTLNYRIDAKNQKVAYTYDTNKRVTQIRRYPVSSGSEDTCQRSDFYYDTNPFDGSFSQYTTSRPTAVQWRMSAGSNCSVSYQMTQMYSYTSAGLMTKKRLKVDDSNHSTTLETAQTYDNEGKVLTVKYPDAWTSGFSSVTGATYTYTYDSMSRAIKLTDNQSTPVDWVKDLQFNGAAGQLTQIKYWNPATSAYYTESRTYNNRLQMTRLTIGTAMDMEYRYSSNQNNGQITQQKDWVMGEEVTYTYDSLQRMITASTTDTSWGQSFTYDGFGNMTAQTVTKGTAPSMSVNIDAATNRISMSGFSYDANGNATVMPVVGAIGYDVDNRTVSAGGDAYGYGVDNKRIFKNTGGNEEFYFYGISGQKMGTYLKTAYGASFVMVVSDTELYFAGKKILSRGVVPLLDQSDSNRNGSRYFPYGQEQTITGQNKDKFATYYRDNTTGLDYAQNRYYANTLGRFTSPDPYGGSAKVGDPGTWNRYAYVSGDPVNRTDRSGLEAAMSYCQAYPDDGECFDFWRCPDGSLVFPHNDCPDTKPDRQVSQAPSMNMTWTAWEQMGLSVAIGNALSMLSEAESECATLFNGPVSPFEVLTRLWQGTGEYGNIGYGPTAFQNDAEAHPVPILNPPGPDGEFVPPTIKTNIWINNHYFDSVFTSPLDRAQTIIHELGHVFTNMWGAEASSIKPDRADGESFENTRRVAEKCTFF